MERRYPSRPLVGVGAVVLDGDRVLLVKRGRPPGLGRWSLPGGAQHLGETVHEAAHREVREETGVDIDILDLVEVLDSIERDETGRVLYHYTLIDFLALWRSGTPQAGDDAAEAAWFEIDRIQELGLWPATQRIIRRAVGMAGDRSKNKTLDERLEPK